VNSSESARTGTLLLLGVARAGGALGAGENAARGKDENVAVGELLLELTGEALLDTVETLQGRDGDKDDNRLLAVANFDLIRPKVSMRAPGCNALLGPLPVLFRALHGCFDVMVIERGQRPPTQMAARSATPLARPPSNVRSIFPMLRRPAGDERTIALPIAPGGTGCRVWFVDLRGCLVQRLHTSRAETNCRGRRATLRSAVLVSRS
jgi:hypothetical protein